MKKKALDYYLDIKFPMRERGYIVVTRQTC